MLVKYFRHTVSSLLIRALVTSGLHIASPTQRVVDAMLDTQ